MVNCRQGDTAGQERYRTITTAYYRGAMGFILMYDITNEESFNSVQDWCTQIKTYSWENAQVVLVGNKCDMDGERVDTAGQERYRTITTAYYRGAMGFILMYDITNEESFNSVQDWCTQIKTYSWENAQVVLVGNKCDMDGERVVSIERGRQLADQLGLEFFETSAKENINVKAVFEKLVEIICDKMAESLDKDPQQQPKGQRLDATTNQKPPTQQCNC
ncbi:Ras family protein [Ancylostoma duodenale]|uniref:Ras family protein n=1 Tax=Ancylostoma duodenale TaxID=51022 RepID=A0A0C2H7F7_9BILA|nr:Ras family protein [Ancylostoma duodenale]